MTDLQLPQLEGKTVGVIYSSKDRNYAYLDHLKMEIQADRLFLTGNIVDVMEHGTDGLPIYIAWDSVASYYVFDSNEHCRECVAKWYPSKKQSWFRRS